ncbi:hypothetical protein BCR32DRAFT_324157 [Anaeromyces robustus]|uniref:Nucleotide-diphospho-sugar transferase n=1 Tax=Anaeromyces robustus TaxID=1754192 RepID=A0A1Y1XQD6_9FUNG|nr:hypothetical protein BCR32DRAFT_324157 [Anaeromyces robustus]|eukprot:ORX87958.1 hypothetical protein BCR32DRAFT_324157 [Anaeromyces robustus]
MISYFKKYIANTIDAVDDLTNMNLVREKTELHRRLWEYLFGTEIYTSDHILNTMLKYQKENEPLYHLFNKVHKNLYPWIYGKKFLALDEFIRSYHGRGIVICTGSFHFKYAQSTIDTLRNVIRTNLPIEIFYNGSEDLSMEEQQTLMAYPKVYLSNLEDIFNNNIIKCKKWSIKPFAILASRFSEVILMDADAMYLRDPAELFKSKGYEETGTIFFRDRTLPLSSHSSDSLTWFKEWAKDPLIETKSSRFWNGITIHEMDSSTVVINKEKVILGLLSVCKLNEFAIREGMVYRHVYGDKETFWMGFDMAHQHYFMSPQPIAFIGSIQPISYQQKKESGTNANKMLCGHIAHYLEDNEIIFWNGHLVVDKVYNSTTLLDFDYYIIEKDTDNENNWSNDPVCYYIDNEEDIIPLSDDDKSLIDMIKERENQNRILLD